MGVALSPRAEEVLIRTKSETGITHVALLERLLEWFAVQDPRLRTMILSPYSQVRQGLAKSLVEEMVANPERDFDGGLQFHGLVHNDYGHNTALVASGGRQRKSRSEAT